MTRRFETKFGSLEHYEKGAVEVIDDDPKHYTFSNVFEVASRSRPYEKVAVGQNRQYVLEAVRAEGTSGWRTASHDEFALVMDGEVEVRLRQLAEGQQAPADVEGSIAVEGEPEGAPMGWVKARRGHMTLLPGRGRLPVPRRPPQRHPHADDRGPGHRLQVGRDHPDV